MRTVLNSELAIVVIAVFFGGASAVEASSEPLLRISEFHTPPVSVSIVSARDKKNHVVVELRNRSSQDIVAVALTLAGEDCKAKPAWPILSYGREVRRARSVHSRPREPPIAPGKRAQLIVPGRMLDRATKISERTCGKRIPPEIQVTHVQFRDGSAWDLGEEVRKGP
jgi:hypothetical protein